MDQEVKHPDVHVQLTGEDGNIFFISGRVTRALRRAGYAQEVSQFAEELTSCGSYEEALEVVERWVDVS